MIELVQEHLQALEAAARTGDAPGLGFEAMAQIGDALRLRVPLPNAVHAQVTGLDETQLAAAAADTLQALRAIEPLDTALAVCMRDQVESARHALALACLARGHGLLAVEGCAEIEQELLDLDASLGQLVDRAQAETLLGPRISMHEAGGWTETLGPSAGAGVELTWNAAFAGVELDRELLTGYLVEGRSAELIEGLAARGGAVVRDLRRLASGLKATGTPLSARARALLAGRADAAVVIPFPGVVDGRVRLAAASDAPREVRTVVVPAIGSMRVEIRLDQVPIPDAPDDAAETEGRVMLTYRLLGGVSRPFRFELWARDRCIHRASINPEDPEGRITLMRRELGFDPLRQAIDELRIVASEG